MNVSIPLVFLFLPYGIFLMIFAFYALFNCFQLLKHGVKSFQTTVILALFIVASALVMITTSAHIATIDWAQSLNVTVPIGTQV